MSRHFHFYDSATGVLHDMTVATDNAEIAEQFAKANAPQGHTPIEGRFDPLTQRVDVQSGQIVDYQPPAPDADHEWDAAAKRWVLKPAVAAAQGARRVALAQIQGLEVQQQRALREAALGDAAAVTRLHAIDQQIAALRLKL